MLLLCKKKKKVFREKIQIYVYLIKTKSFGLKKKK